ncbi:MAG: class I SAM-dependent methyltransferase [Bacteroidetes bacterium]|nr:MAG: class I SAM-dependent methyltransferase [Bacteroidota bacterium]
MKFFWFVAGALILFSFAACDTTPSDPGPSPRVEEQQVDSANSQKPPLRDMKATYENTDRVVWQRPNLIISLLANNQDLGDKVVVDIGAGTGFFTKRLAPLAKKVIALDIDQQFLNFIDSTKVLEVPAPYYERIETRLTPVDAPNLAPGEADAVLLVNTFMFIENKREYLDKLKTAIKDGGRLVIVDFKRKRTTIGPEDRSLRTPLYVVEDLLYEANYRNIEAIDTELNYQYIVIADK